MEEHLPLARHRAGGQGYSGGFVGFGCYEPRLRDRNRRPTCSDPPTYTNYRCASSIFSQVASLLGFPWNPVAPMGFTPWVSERISRRSETRNGVRYRCNLSLAGHEDRQ